MRLIRAADFSAVFADQQRFHSAHFLLLTRRNEYNYPRLGLAIAKKHLPTAVQRNRVKRLVRESFRELESELTNRDLIVLSKKQLGQDWAQLNKLDLRQELDNLVKRLK